MIGRTLGSHWNYFLGEEGSRLFFVIDGYVTVQICFEILVGETPQHLQQICGIETVLCRSVPGTGRGWKCEGIVDTPRK